MHICNSTTSEDSITQPVDMTRDLNAVLAIEQMLTTGGGWQDQIGAGERTLDIFNVEESC
jgi:hypothetical protein